ncbi:MAG: hypothetical protein Q9M91_01850 [Candidatus Dojkabacteria bacterium]|nr:hypothetical protein [Candidatus Dojkabacteria bacterium]
MYGFLEAKDGNLNALEFTVNRMKQQGFRFKGGDTNEPDYSAEEIYASFRSFESAFMKVGIPDSAAITTTRDMTYLVSYIQSERLERFDPSTIPDDQLVEYKNKVKGVIDTIFENSLESLPRSLRTWGVNRLVFTMMNEGIVGGIGG